jgi:molybdenum cofactor guanylyltransferase
MDGQDKGLLPLIGKPLIEYILEKLPHDCPVFISANRNQGTYQQYDLPVISDEIQNYAGPLAGIASTLKYIHTPVVQIISCDSPFVDAKLIQDLADEKQRRHKALCLPTDGTRQQPLFMQFDRQLDLSLNDYLDKGGRKVLDWIAEQDNCSLDMSERKEMFININQPDDLTQAEEILKHA